MYTVPGTVADSILFEPMLFKRLATFQGHWKKFIVAVIASNQKKTSQGRVRQHHQTKHIKTPLLHSLKLTVRPWKDGILKRNLVFQPSILRGKLAVSFREGICCPEPSPLFCWIPCAHWTTWPGRPAKTYTLRVTFFRERLSAAMLCDVGV